MFFSVVFGNYSSSSEIDVEEDTFVSLITDIHSNSKVFCISDDDGCNFYYFNNRINDIVYIGCSSEIFPDIIDSFF